MNITQQFFCICNFIAIVSIFTYKNITLWLKESKELFGMIALSKACTNDFSMTKWILLWLDPLWMPPPPFLECITWEEGFGRSTKYLSQFYLKGCTNMGDGIYWWGWCFILSCCACWWCFWQPFFTSDILHKCERLLTIFLEKIDCL